MAKRKTKKPKKVTFRKKVLSPKQRRALQIAVAASARARGRGASAIKRGRKRRKR